MLRSLLKYRRILLAFCLLALLSIGTLQAATNIACVGDSITAGLGSDGYPVQLQRLLGSSYSVGNYGYPGTRLMNIPAGSGYTATQQYTDSRNSNPNIVIIQLGTNDAWDASTWKANSYRFVEQYVALINSYKTLPTKPKVYLSLCVWSADAGIENILTNELLPLTRLVANLTGCEFIDNHYAMYRRLYDYTQRDGNNDGVHPGDAGYAVLARSIYDQLIFRSTSVNFGATNVKPEGLNDQYTLNAIYNDTTKYSVSGGIDRSGHAYSSKLLPALAQWSTISSLDWRDSFTAPVASFFMGHPDYLNAVSNGVTIPLPNDRCSAIRLLGAAVNGAQLNQNFVITYEDGSTVTRTISLSDWTSTGALQSGEGVVASVPYRTTSTGVTQSVATRVYGYTLSVDPMRVLRSVKLPANQNVVILGAALTGQTNATLGTLSGTTTGAFQAQANNLYIGAAYAAGVPLQANKTSVGSWETFDVKPAASPAPNALSGIFTLTARINNVLVQTTLESSDASAPMGAVGPAPGGTVAATNEYAWISNYDGTFSLQSLVNGRYASLGNTDPNNLWAGDSNKTVKASASALTSTEKFTLR